MFCCAFKCTNRLLWPSMSYPGRIQEQTLTNKWTPAAIWTYWWTVSSLLDTCPAVEWRASSSGWAKVGLHLLSRPPPRPSPIKATRTYWPMTSKEEKIRLQAESSENLWVTSQLFCPVLLKQYMVKTLFFFNKMIWQERIAYFAIDLCQEKNNFFKIIMKRTTWLLTNKPQTTPPCIYDVIMFVSFSDTASLTQDLQEDLNSSQSSS